MKYKALVVAVGQSHALRAVCRDKSRRTVNEGLVFHWKLIEGEAALSEPGSEIVTLTAPVEPGLVRVRVTVTQDEFTCSDEAAVTITDQLLDTRGGRRSVPTQGLPGYTLEHAPSALWRSRHDADRNLIVVNKGHRDFVYANRNSGTGDDSVESVDGAILPDDSTADRKQKDFFEFPGPLFSVRISPTSSVVAVGQSHALRAVCRCLLCRPIRRRGLACEFRTSRSLPPAVTI